MNRATRLANFLNREFDRWWGSIKQYENSGQIRDELKAAYFLAIKTKKQTDQDITLVEVNAIPKQFPINNYPDNSSLKNAHQRMHDLINQFVKVEQYFEPENFPQMQTKFQTLLNTKALNDLKEYLQRIKAKDDFVIAVTVFEAAIENAKCLQDLFFSLKDFLNYDCVKNVINQTIDVTNTKGSLIDRKLAYLSIFNFPQSFLNWYQEIRSVASEEDITDVFSIIDSSLKCQNKNILLPIPTPKPTLRSSLFLEAVAATKRKLNQSEINDEGSDLLEQLQDKINNEEEQLYAARLNIVVDNVGNKLDTLEIKTRKQASQNIQEQKYIIYIPDFGKSLEQAIPNIRQLAQKNEYQSHFIACNPGGVNGSTAQPVFPGEELVAQYYTLYRLLIARGVQPKNITFYGDTLATELMAKAISQTAKTDFQINEEIDVAVETINKANNYRASKLEIKGCPTLIKIIPNSFGESSDLPPIIFEFNPAKSFNTNVLDMQNCSSKHQRPVIGYHPSMVGNHLIPQKMIDFLVKNEKGDRKKIQIKHVTKKPVSLLSPSRKQEETSKNEINNDKPEESPKLFSTDPYSSIEDKISEHSILDNMHAQFAQKSILHRMVAPLVKFYLKYSIKKEDKESKWKKIARNIKSFITKSKKHAEDLEKDLISYKNNEYLSSIHTQLDQFFNDPNNSLSNLPLAVKDAIWNVVVEQIRNSGTQVSASLKVITDYLSEDQQLTKPSRKQKKNLEDKSERSFYFHHTASEIILDYKVNNEWKALNINPTDEIEKKRSSTCLIQEYLQQQAENTQRQIQDHKIFNLIQQQRYNQFRKDELKLDYRKGNLERKEVAELKKHIEGLAERIQVEVVALERILIPILLGNNSLPQIAVEIKDASKHIAISKYQTLWKISFSLEKNGEKNEGMWEIPFPLILPMPHQCESYRNRYRETIYDFCRSIERVQYAELILGGVAHLLCQEKTPKVEFIFGEENLRIERNEDGFTIVANILKIKQSDKKAIKAQLSEKKTRDENKKSKKELLTPHLKQFSKHFALRENNPNPSSSSSKSDTLTAETQFFSASGNVEIPVGKQEIDPPPLSYR